MDDPAPAEAGDFADSDEELCEPAEPADEESADEDPAAEASEEPDEREAPELDVSLRESFRESVR